MESKTEDNQTNKKSCKVMYLQTSMTTIDGTDTGCTILTFEMPYCNDVNYTIDVRDHVLKKIDKRGVIYTFPPEENDSNKPKYGILYMGHIGEDLNDCFKVENREPENCNQRLNTFKL